MDSILIILKKKMAQGLHLPLYWDYFLYHSYIQQISGERLQDHWSSCIHVYDHNIQTSSLKPLGQSKPNFMWSIVWKGELKFI